MMRKFTYKIVQHFNFGSISDRIEQISQKIQYEKSYHNKQNMLEEEILGPYYFSKIEKGMSTCKDNILFTRGNSQLNYILAENKTFRNFVPLCLGFCKQCQNFVRTNRKNYMSFLSLRHIRDGVKNFSIFLAYLCLLILCKYIIL